MLLKKSDTAGDIFEFVMSPAEWQEIYALAKFAQDGLAYDVIAPYVEQVFTYRFMEAHQFRADPDTQAAFTALDRLGAENPGNGKDIIFTLPKEEMRQFLIALTLAAPAREQAEFLGNALAGDFPLTFPALAMSPEYYEEAFDRLISALQKEESLKIERPTGL